MTIINIQQKTKPKTGKIESYFFENENIGLKKTLFHRITIPLVPFDSGIDYESQPLATEIVIDWLELNLTNPNKLDELNINSRTYGSSETSIYLGSVHNECDIISLEFSKLEENLFDVRATFFVKFEHEDIGKNESFSFKTQLQLMPLAID